MEGTEDEKQRRISRILTIDEIINPPGSSRRHPQTPPPPLMPEINHGPSANSSNTGSGVVSAGNPNAGHSFMRFNHGRVTYTPGIATIPELDSPPGREGIKNPGFVGSSASVHHHNHQPNVRVYHEQYWNWSCQCSSWSKRERVLLLVVGVLGFIILGLVAIISVYARDHKFGSSLPDFVWTF